MAGLRGGPGQSSPNVIFFKLGMVLNDLCVAGAMAQKIEHVLHPNSQSTQARPPAALVRLNGDAIEKWMGHVSSPVRAGWVSGSEPV